MTCSSLELQINELVSNDMYAITIAASEMAASDMNYLLRCLANSENVRTAGYTKIDFDDWSGLDGELDSDILQ